jgi:hypothetical protein
MKPIIVIGCHRSGTGLLSNILHHMGVWMGGEQDSNFEPYYFILANERLLFHFGATWDNPLPFMERMKSRENFQLAADLLYNYPYQHRDFFDDFLGEGRTTIKQLPKHWGWKEPRTTVTLPLWLQYFPEAKIIYMQRDGNKVADSIFKRHQEILHIHYDGKVPAEYPLTKLIHAHYVIHSHRPANREEAYKIWQEYEQIAEHWLQRLPNNPCLRVRYEDLLKAPNETIDQLANFCELEPTFDKQKIIGLVKPGA